MLLSRLKHPHFSDQYGCLILLFCLQPTQSCSIRGWVNVSRKASSTHGTLMAVHRSGDPRMKNQRKVKNILKVQPGAARLLRDQLWKHGCKTKKACCPPQGQPSFPPSLIQYTCSEPFAHTHTHTHWVPVLVQSSLGDCEPQYSTVTALVLRYSMRASSPVDTNDNLLKACGTKGFLL